MPARVTRTPEDQDKTRIAVDRFDRLVIGNIPYRLSIDFGDVLVFNIEDGTGCAIQFTQAELRGYARRRQLCVDRNFYHPDKSINMISGGGADLKFSELDDRTQAIVSKRTALADAAEELVAESRLKLTDRDIAANMDRIVGLAQQFVGRHDVRISDRHVKALDWRERPAPGTLRKWVAKRRKHGCSALVPAFAKRGGTGTMLHHEVRKIMRKAIDGYLVLNGPSKKDIFLRICRAVDKENEVRSAKSLPPLNAPCQATVSKNIDKLDKCQVMIAREGAERARKTFRPVLSGVMVTRPLERVEIDEHQLDLWTLIEENDWQDKVSPELLDKLRKANHKIRFWITLAIDCATKAIVGLTITPSASSEAAMRTLEMILSDKGIWSDRVGALRPWNMYGLPEKIVTDCGSAFRSEVFRHACADLGIVAERVIAGHPEMRGAGERIFRTVNGGLCCRLAGNTFHELISEKQPSDLPTGYETAALTVEDLSFAIVRWIVDIYHNSPHEGLNGETPRACWDRLVLEHGVMPPPDAKRIRMVFGTRLQRGLTKSGITVLGIRYHSAPLAAYLKGKKPTQVDLRWHPSDLGSVAVHLDKGWVEVPSVQPDFDGIPAETWLTAAKHARQGRHKAKDIDLRVVLEAMEAITQRSDAAVVAAGMSVDPWNPPRIAQSESRIFAGVNFRETSSAKAAEAPVGIVGTPIPEPIDPPFAPEVADRAPAVSKPKPGETRKPPRSGGAPLIIEED